ncbi:MAG: hypothetical protein QNK37_26845 [Acidobacteriota bacterium]|nr:hypothetical protein [Acidobacteriota bacterium]
MNKSEMFWAGIKRLASCDNSTEVPPSTRESALAIFDRKKEPQTNHLFSLTPASLATVRKAGQSRKFFYELKDYIVQLEKTEGEGCYQLSGFVHGIDDGPVILYGDESVFETEIENGNFSFDSLSYGSYRLCLSHEGDHYWITGVQLLSEETA